MTNPKWYHRLFRFLRPTVACDTCKRVHRVEYGWLARRHPKQETVDNVTGYSLRDMCFVYNYDGKCLRWESQDDEEA